MRLRLPATDRPGDRRGLAIAAALVIASAACAERRATPLVGSSQELWVRALVARRADPASTANPLAWTEEMRLEAERLAGRGGIRERLRALQDGLFDRARFPFEYESGGTLTAIEAFGARRGNCLSFTSLFVAMARSIGIEVRAAAPEVSRRSEVEGDLVVVHTHVVAAYPFHEGLEIYDFDRARERRVVGARLLDDLELAALHENNRGVESLREGRVREAEARFETAARLSPDFAAAWGNLGVARRRAGDLRGALRAYEAGLEVDPRDPGILGNLATLHRTLGDERAARAALELADLGKASPYFLVVRGDLERAQGDLRGAVRLYRRAHRRSPGLPGPLVSIAAAELERGRIARARAAARAALELDPGSEEARRVLERAEAP